VSQRYVEVKPGTVIVPPLREAEREIYVATATRMMDAYHHLIDVLTSDVEREYFKLFPAREKRADAWKSAVKKKAQECARYVLPVATHAHLYHTVSGLTLHRYNRLSRMFDVPTETRVVVARMVNEVNRADPLFFRNIEDPLPIDATPEFQALAGRLDAAGEIRVGDGTARAFRDAFDRDLGGRTSRLVDYKVNAEAVLANAVRATVGAPCDSMSDDDAISRALAPERNGLFAEALNLVYHAKLTRALAHPHYTFAKRLSHTADSQDQRHRMAPASRPVLAAQFVPGEPDVIVPLLVSRNAEARDAYLQLMREVWRAIESLLAADVPCEFALYLLPNAFPIRFFESGDLLALHHKWTARLCYAAQEEIWQASLDEVEAVRRVHPRVAAAIGPPCHMRQRAGVRPYCPEGPRYCGVPVWKLGLADFTRVL
jgi:thymidylate synthase ThyX